MSERRPGLINKVTGRTPRRPTPGTDRPRAPRTTRILPRPVDEWSSVISGVLGTALLVMLLRADESAMGLKAPALIVSMVLIGETINTLTGKGVPPSAQDEPPVGPTGIFQIALAVLAIWLGVGMLSVVASDTIYALVAVLAAGFVLARALRGLQL